MWVQFLEFEECHNNRWRSNKLNNPLNMHMLRVYIVLLRINFVL